MRYAASVAILLLFTVGGWAQEVKLPPEVKAEPGMILVKAETDCSTVAWWAPDGGLQVIPADLLKNTMTAVCFAIKPGRYRLVAMVAKEGKPAYAVTTVIVGEVPPIPPGPEPEPPGPGPKPPTPVSGLHVLILFESGDAGKLSAGQQGVIYGKQVRDWLNANTALGPDNKTRAWRIWDKDVDASGEAKIWQDLLARKRTGVPWIIIAGSGGVAYEGPLLSNVQETIALLSKYSTTKAIHHR